MLSCIIIDDEEKDRQNLELLLKNYCPEVDIVAKAWDKESIINVLQNHTVDVVFMDIHLGRTTCFDIIKDWDKEELDFKIVFVTASEKHAIMGYQYNAIDYILKPIHSQRLIEVVDKIKKIKDIETVSKEEVVGEFKHLYDKMNNNRKISITDGSEICVLKIDDILYCESDGNYTKIIRKGAKEMVISKQLKYFETHLNVYEFLRVHRSYLVNIIHIDALSKKQGGYIVMSNGVSIPVSQSCKEILFAKMNII